MGMLKFRWGYVAPMLWSLVLLATIPVVEGGEGEKQNKISKP